MSLLAWMLAVLAVIAMGTLQAWAGGLFERYESPIPNTEKEFWDRLRNPPRTLFLFVNADGTLTWIRGDAHRVDFDSTDDLSAKL